MLRALTWLHLTLGGSAKRRGSASITRTPRALKSMAVVKPTGPAPAMKMSVS